MELELWSRYPTEFPISPGVTRVQYASLAMPHRSMSCRCFLPAHSPHILSVQDANSIIHSRARSKERMKIYCYSKKSKSPKHGIPRVIPYHTVIQSSHYQKTQFPKTTPKQKRRAHQRWGLRHQPARRPISTRPHSNHPLRIQHIDTGIADGLVEHSLA